MADTEWLCSKRHLFATCLPWHWAESIPKLKTLIKKVSQRVIFSISSIFSRPFTTQKFSCCPRPKLWAAGVTSLEGSRRSGAQSWSWPSHSALLHLDIFRNLPTPYSFRCKQDKHVQASQIHSCKSMCSSQEVKLVMKSLKMCVCVFLFAGIRLNHTKSKISIWDVNGGELTKPLALLEALCAAHPPPVKKSPFWH